MTSKLNPSIFSVPKKDITGRGGQIQSILKIHRAFQTNSEIIKATKQNVLVRDFYMIKFVTE